MESKLTGTNQSMRTEFLERRKAWEEEQRRRAEEEAAREEEEEVGDMAEHDDGRPCSSPRPVRYHANKMSYRRGTAGIFRLAGGA